MKCPKCLTENDPKALFCNNCAAHFLPPADAAASRTKTFETPIEELSTGSSFAGRYQIIEELGKGGMGKVYKAYDKEINAKIAIKLIKPEVAGDQSSIDRFRNELKLARDISHKNICRMYDLNKIGSTYFITMEYVHGEDLKKIMGKIGILSPGQTVSIAKQVCEGLSEAHKLGIIHRDLKPSNIMLDNSGNVRIMDFGIARTLKTRGITDSGVVIGTPEYMSPEQVEANAVDARSDIYSLGIILYEMVTGQLPFRGDTPLAIGIKHKTEAPEEPAKLNGQIPGEVNQLILKCLKKRREERYQSADELAAELIRLEKRIPTSKRIVPSKRPITSKEITLKLRFGKLLATATIISLIGLAIIFLFTRKRADRDLSQNPIFRQITFSQNAYSPEISPDGQALAYCRKNAGGGVDLLVKDVVTEQELKLLSALSINQLEWLPNGSELSVRGWGIQEHHGQSGYLISRFGGSARPFDDPYEAIAWSPDSNKYAGYATGRIEIRDRASDSVTTVPLRVNLMGVSDIAWSPKGDKLLLLNRDGIGSTIWIMNLDGAKPLKIFAQANPIFSVAWPQSGGGIYYLVSQKQFKEVWKLPIDPDSGRPTDKPRRLLVGFQGGRTFSIPQKGSPLFVTYVLSNWELWHLHMDKQANIRSTISTRLSSSSLAYIRPSISPDREQVAYSRGDSKISNIFILSIDGGQERQLTHFNSYNSNPVWSRDGEQLAFISNQGGERQVWIISVKTGQLSQVPNSKGKDITSLYWSPGKELLFASRLQNNSCKGLYFAETGRPLYENAWGLAFCANFLDPSDSWARYSGDIGENFPSRMSISDTHFYDISYSADGQKIGGLASNLKTNSMGFLLISLADMSHRFFESTDKIDYSRLSTDGLWIQGRSQLHGDFRLNIGDGRIEQIPFLDISIEGSLFKKTIDGGDEVVVVRKPTSDIWAIEGFETGIR